MIDISAIRNYLRSRLIAANIIASTRYAWEGREFDPGNAAYIAEIVSPEGDVKAATDIFGSTMTLTYNVYTVAGDTAGVNNTGLSYTLVNAICDLFALDKTVEVPGTTIRYTVDAIRRRVASELDGWRLAPVDITIRAQQPIS